MLCDILYQAGKFSKSIYSWFSPKINDKISKKAVGFEKI